MSLFLPVNTWESDINSAELARRQILTRQSDHMDVGFTISFEMMQLALKWTGDHIMTLSRCVCVGIVQWSVTLSPPLAALMLYRKCWHGCVTEEGNRARCWLSTASQGAGYRGLSTSASDPSTKTLIRSTNKKPGKTKLKPLSSLWRKSSARGREELVSSAVRLEEE